jgi:uncharacterized protein YegP (UPF0339 family)
MSTFQIYRDPSGAWRWTLTADGTVLAKSGESFVSAEAARSGIEAVKRDAGSTEVDDLSGDEL